MADGNDVVCIDQPCKVLESLLPPSPTWYTSYGCDGNEIGIFVCASRNYLNVFKVNNLTTAAEQAIDLSVASTSNELSYNLLASLSHAEKVHVTALGPRHRIAKDDDLVLAVACCDDGTVHLWDVFSQKEIQYHDKHKSKVTAAAWSLSEPDLVITGDERGFIALFKFDTNCSLKLHHPEKCQVSCMTFSPHNLDLLAVGYKSGNIILMNVSATSLTVVKKFPGHHDDITSLVWCPQPGEQFCAQKPSEAETDTNAEGGPTTDTDYLFASGSKDQKICIWSTKKDYCLTSMSLPNNVGTKREKSSETVRLWVALHWPRKNPNTLVSSVYSGVMLKWDLSCPGKKKFVIFSAASNCSHNRIVFNIASLGLDHNILLTNSQDRNMIFWDIDKCKSVHIVSTFGGFVYDVHAVPLDPGRLALGIGDNTIRIWNRTKDSNRFLVQIWQKIKSKVTVVRWHPTYEGLLAYGTDDGRVATVEVNSHKPPSICSSYHSKTVYCLDWGKPTYKAGSTNTNQSLYNLYSQGENTILQHYINSSEPATNVNHIIQHTNGKNESGTFPNRTEIRWSPDFSLVAIGNIDGSVEIFLPPHLQLMCTINIFSKIINCISWHPLYTTSYNMMSTCSNWLAIGSNDSVVHVVDLTIVIKENASDSKEIVTITESLHSLEGHSKRITGLCWSTHNEGHLVTISYDKTAVVWNVKKGEALAHYRGHSGRLMCVSWSLTDPNLIYTGSDDCFLHGWRISEHHCQPKLHIKKSVKVKKRSTAKKAGGSVASAVTTSDKNEELVGNKERSSSPSTELSDVQLGIETDDSISSSNKKAVLAPEASQDRYEPVGEEGDPGIVDNPDDLQTETAPNKSSKISAQLILGPHLSSSSNLSAPKQYKSKDNVKKSLRKTRKSFFPLATKMEQRGRESTLKDIVNLAKKTFDPDSITEPLEFHLGFFLGRREAYELLKVEGQSHIDHDNMEYHLHMEIWKGNISTALTWAKEREELSDWLVAMAPLASHGTWLTVCEDYAYQLESDGEYHKAVTYLVACHRIYEAIDLFKRHRLFKEAVTFAKVRLSPVDPVFEDLYSMWAQQLAKEGNYEQAAKCYLAIKQVQDASRCLTKRTDHVCMRTAAHISLLAMEKQNGLLLAQRVIHQYLQKMQYQEAYNFTQEHSNLKVFTLVISMHELMMNELLTLMPSVVYAKDSSVFVLHKRRMTSLTGSKTLLPDFILDSNDIDPLCPWKPYLINKHTFFNHVLRTWHQCLDVDLESGNVEDMYKIFNTLISGRQSFVNIDQLLMQNCMDLTLCMLSLLQGETTAAIKHLLQAMVNLHDASQYQLLQIISQLCLPQGPKYLLKLQQEVTAVRVLITIDKSGDDLSKLDTTLKMNTTKRYLSDLKDDNQVFNCSLRCRELDCVRAYYYIGVLRYLFDRQQSLESKTIPSQQSAVSNMVHAKSRTDEDNNPYTPFQPLHELESMNQTKDNSLVEKTNSSKSNSNNNNNNNIADSHSDGINTNPNNNKQTSNNQECCYDNRARTDFNLTFHKFRYLSKCLLWDIQGKRFALTEKLGYIHRAISQLLLEQKPKNDKTDSGTILCENGKSNSNNENFQKTEDIPSQENVRLQTPDLIPTGHETSIPSPLQSGASSPTDIKELPLPINEILVDEPSAHVPNVTHCLSPCQEDEPYKAVTKPRKVLWKDELPASNHLCPLHRKYVNVPDVWYDYTVDEKYTKPYVTMAILQDEQELVMSELKQGPENPTQILFPRPLSSAQLLLTVIWNCEDFDGLEKTQLIDETVSWALKYSLTSAQQKIFHNLKDQMKI